MKLGILGLGKMGSAILNGLLETKLPYEIYTYSHHPVLADIKVLSSEVELFETVDVFIFCIKPQSFSDVIAKLSGTKHKPALIISIAAGIKLEYLRIMLNAPKIVRLMPNTACAIKEGVITLAKSESVLESDLKIVFDIFSPLGKVYPCTEAEINKLLPLNGSFPAYLYSYIEAFIKAAVKEGTSYELAKEVLLNTIIGSTHLALSGNKELPEMIADVCSKKGTTIEGVDALNEGNFNDLVENCYQACYRRAIELEK